jgi:hypothetical protein
MKTILGTLFAFFILIPVFGQDKSSDILLVHAGTVELGTTGYSYSSDVTLKYIAEYLWGLLEATSGYADAQVDYDSEAYAHSLSDIYYDPMHADLKATIGSGYRYVVLFDSDQAQAYPEILYEGCKQLSQTVLDAGGTPLLMMYRTDYLETEQLGEYAYRAGNGCGVDVVPAGYALEVAGLPGKQVAEARAQQAWLFACAIYTKITGLDPIATGYSPSYDKFEWSYNEYYDTRYAISDTDTANLRSYAVDAVETHSTNVHYNTSYEFDGSVVYRSIDVAAEPILNDIHYFYKGSSTHEFTAERIDIMVADTVNAPLTASVHFLGNQNFDTRNWTTNDLALRADTFATYADRGLFLFVGGSDEGAYAQDIIDSNQSNLVPMVFDWIKGFDRLSGTASTTAALNNQDCADLWDHYYLRGWKTIPLTVAMGRLNEKLPNFIASDDALHLSDPVMYMNASMMLTSTLGAELEVPSSMSIRRGDWTQAELKTAVLTGQEVIKELAYMSETAAYVPDSALGVLTDDLPGAVVGVPYTYPLQAAGGDEAYSWEVVSSSGLPAGLSLSSDGLLSGAAYEAGSFGLAFKVTDGTGAFRKVGLKLSIDPNSELPVANDDSITLLVNTTAAILLTGTDSDGSTSNLTYEVIDGPTNGTLTGTAPNLIYSPNPDFVGEDRFTFTVSDGVNDSVPATVSIVVGPAQTDLEFVDLNTDLIGNSLMVGGSANNLAVLGSASGSDYVYSVTYSGADYDYDGLNDTLSFDVRVKGWSGGTTDAAIDAAGSTYDASATIGTTPTAVVISGSTFVAGDINMSKGESLEFLMESLTVSLSDPSKFGSAVSAGFSSARLEQNSTSGNSHQAIFGSGTGLLGWDFDTNQESGLLDVGTGSLYVSSDLGDGTRSTRWGVANVDFGISVSVGRAGASDTAISAGSGGMILSWTAASGASYSITATTNLVTGPWVEVANGIYGNDDSVSVTNLVAEDSLFYRVYRDQ